MSKLSHSFSFVGENVLFAIRNMVLPATRQRWHSCLYSNKVGTWFSNRDECKTALPGWQVTYRDGIPARRQGPIPIQTCVRCRENFIDMPRTQPINYGHYSNWRIQGLGRRCWSVIYTVSVAHMPPHKHACNTWLWGRTRRYRWNNETRHLAHQRPASASAAAHIITRGSIQQTSKKK